MHKSFVTRRIVLSVAAAITCTSAVAQQPSQASWPNRPITFVVPYPAGGTTDLLARLIAEHWTADLKLTFAVENRPGAATALGATQVAKAAPDGHTLLMATSTTLAINKHLYKKLGYDPIADFAPVARLAGVPFALIVNPTVPAKDLKEFIQLAKAKPGALTYASPGNGSPHHLATEMLKAMAGLDIKHVTYRGSVPAMNDIVGGHVPVMFMDLAPAIPLIKGGQLRALAVSTPRRLAVFPDLPTVAESGLAGFEAVAWQGVVAPAGLPDDIKNRLAESAKAFLNHDANRQKLLNLSIEPLEPLTPEAFAAYITAELARWGHIVQAAGIVIE